MEKIRVFVASSGSLAEERKELELFISRKNDELISRNIYVELVLWEKMSRSFNQSRKQNDFNDQIVDSDIFLCLIFDKVGQFTYEEFRKAYDSFLSLNRPKRFFVAFKDEPINPSKINESFNSVLQLKEEIRKIEQIWFDYKNINELLLFFDAELKRAIIEHETKQSNSKYFIPFTHTIIDLLDRTGSEVYFHKFSILQAKKEMSYFEDDACVEGSIDEKSIYVDLGDTHDIEYGNNYCIVRSNFKNVIKPNEKFTRNFYCKFIDSFTEEDGFHEEDNVGEVGLLRITVIFPDERLPKEHYVSSLMGPIEILKAKAKECRYRGKFALVFEVDNKFKSNSRYRINWIW